MYRKYVKQILDRIIALFLLIILFPLIVITAMILIIDLGFPIWNRLRLREGLNKKTYVMYKFRTKKLGKERIYDGSEYKKVSYVIDRLRLNELPQLINVIKGDMALVGPRPFIPGDNLPDIPIPKERYLVRPGLTGLAQIEKGRSITHEEKLQYDVTYYNNISFFTDFLIIVKTPIFLIKNFISKHNY